MRELGPVPDASGVTHHVDTKKVTIEPLRGVAVGCVETAEHAAVANLAATQLRGSAFGLLAAAQSLGNFVASAVAGLLWTLVSPAAAFGYLVVWMALALVGLLTAHRAAVAAP